MPKKVISGFKVLFTSSLIAGFIPAGLYACGSGTTINSVTLSAASAGLGQSISATVVYQQTSTYDSVDLLGAFNLNQTTFQSCNTPGQDFVVYAGFPGNGDSPGAGPDSGGYHVVPGGTAPVTQVFTVTVPPGLTPGLTYNFIVGGSGCDAKCGDLGNMESQNSATLTIMLPPPSCSATLVTESTTAGPNGLLLFDVDYDFVNAGGSNIVCPLPAGVTYVSAGPNAVYNGGTDSVSWDLGTVTSPQTGMLWALVSVDSGTPDGTVITVPNGTLNSAGCGSASFPGAGAVTVRIPRITRTKSESASSLAAGQAVTYDLDWTAAGQNLQLYDSYDYDPSGTSTTDGSNVTGFDGTNYVDVPAASDPGTWVVGSDAMGNHFVSGSALLTAGGGNGHYPELIRNVPGWDICGDFIVQGDLQIPATIDSSAQAGADCHMVVACNPSQGITFKAGISIDGRPGNLFVQYNNTYQDPYWTSEQDNSLPFTITSGVWYTLKTEVLFNGGGSAVSFVMTVWPKDNPANSATVTLYDNTAVTGDAMPACSGGWRAGWQVDETAGTDWFSNLKVFGPGPILNAAVTDAVPPGVTYVGSSAGGVYDSGTNTLSWGAPAAFPTTLFSFDNPVQWWGTVSCPGPIVNQFTMAADSIPAALSNPVTLAVNSCVTPGTATDTPTATPTYTPTLSPTPTLTLTPTLTPTPRPTATPTQTPIGLHVWPNPFNPLYAGGGLLKAYQVPSGASMRIFTVSGEAVTDPLAPDATGLITWNGKNKNGAWVSNGVYYYVIRAGDSTLLKGKLLVSTEP